MTGTSGSSLLRFLSMVASTLIFPRFGPTLAQVVDHMGTRPLAQSAGIFNVALGSHLHSTRRFSPTCGSGCFFPVRGPSTVINRAPRPP